MTAREARAAMAAGTAAAGRPRSSAPTATEAAAPADAANPGALLVVAYRGTRYSGWERQGKGEDTVRGRLEWALADLLGRAVSVAAAGRTDAGVHAAALPVLVPGPLSLSPERLPAALEARLPRDIVIRSAEPAAPGFHPRFDAVGKTYVYNIWSERRAPPFWEPYVWARPGPLDRERLAEAALALSGRRDYAAFGRAGRRVRDTVRDVRLRVSARGPLTTIWAEADGFLYKMVRALVGTMVEAARGAMPVESLSSFVPTPPDGSSNGPGRPPDRAGTGPTAPASGLTLVEVRYPGRTVRADDFIDLLPPRP